ncbi:MAG: cation diffusion facilitator family transporter [Alcanivorax sp.]|nr:cation diffusion facilitator family transporter [Alcanivorax sp.]
MSADVKRDHRLLILAGLSSVVTAVLLIAAKTVAWLMTGSVSLLASLVDSIMDSIASLINFIAIRYSLVPPDEDHRFGHGKAEALAGLGQSVFIFGSSIFLMAQAVQKLMDPQPLQATQVGVAVMVFSIVMTLVLLMIQKFVVRETGSTAIEADSLHYASDLAVNVGIILVLLVSPFGLHWLDGLVGLVIAVFILRSAWQIGFESIQLLLDREIPGNVRETVGAIVAEHELALGFHDLRTRQAGRTQFIQLHVDMDQNLSLLQAHALAESIELRIRDRYPAADVIIHQDPVAVGPHINVEDKLT